MSGDVHNRTFNNINDGVSNKPTAEETLLIINQQCQQIEELKNKLDTVMTERDLLLCEVSRLKFELEIADLKRIHDDRLGMGKERNAQTFVSCNINGTSGKEGEEPRPDTVFPCHAWSQGISKKGSMRSGSDIIKRSRFQNVYELSQDLLDKQIEMLERKYGGVKARNAALTIQRAFRRYTLLKKFAAITAMAKAEKRLSRRLVGFTEEGGELPHPHSHRLPLEGYLPPGPPSMPLRSMSMRERRHNGGGNGGTVVNNGTVLSPTSALPRSHSGRCDLNYCCDVPHTLYYAPQDIYMDVSKDIDMERGDMMVTSTPSPSSENSYHPMPQKYHGMGSVSSGSSGGGGAGRRVPPEVPKRTSSISLRSLDHPGSAALTKTSDSGSLSSVQSSGSDSSNLAGTLAPPPNASWSKKSQVSEMVRKRQYRVGLNLFNKKPERGISYLVRQMFLENSPQSVARFLISRKGLSKQMIGEFLGNLQNSFNSAVLECFAQELDLSGMQVDVALRKFQTYFRMPGEAQKIERLMEVFSHRYCHCNRDVVARLRNMDTIFVLAFAIIMLNTDLHTPNLKPECRMKLEDFIKNLRGIDDCGDIDRDMLVGIYERVKANEFKPGSDHVTQVLKVQSTIVGKKPNMALPHRRLVCYCRLYEVPDINKKERPGVHQREVFLFNDLLVVTKILSKKKNSVTYTFRQSFSLQGLVVSLFQVSYYSYGIKLSQRVDNRTLIIFNARNDHDRCKFAEDMRESISEMDEMESLRIEAELERQKSGRSGRSGGVENRDSGVADVEVCPCIQSPVSTNPPEPKPSSVAEMIHSNQLKRSALSNSLLDIHDQFVGEKATMNCQRRGSVGSLDSGMSISFQSSVSRDSSPHCKGPGGKQQGPGTGPGSGFLTGLFAKRERKASRAEEFARATQV